MRNRSNQREKETNAKMNSTDIVDHNSTAWYVTEAAAFVGARQRRTALIERVAERIRRRTRPEQIISSGIFHTARVALYIGAAYVLKLAFGIGIAVQQAIR
jgi:hypothetical protein